MNDLVPPQYLHNPKASVSTVGYGDDRSVHAVFDDEFVKNDYKSAEQGRPIFDHWYSIELQYPGDNTKTFKKRFSKEDAARGNEWTERFPRQWEAFKNATAQVPDGTPIEMWPPLDKKRVFELKAAKIFTVEQIAALTDATGPNAIGMDWRKLRDMAQAHLNPSASAAQLSKLMRDNEAQAREIDILKQQVSALANGQALESLPKKRGPKPKLQPETVAA